MSNTKPTVFISYSHKDEEWKNQLLPHLKAFEQQGDLLLWHDRRIDTGADWFPEIEEAVERSRVAVCIISENFLASDFIIKEEVPDLLKRREAKDLIIMPLLAEPCPWQAIRWLKGIQMFPSDNNCLAAIRGKTKRKQLLADFAIKVADQAVPTRLDELLTVRKSSTCIISLCETFQPSLDYRIEISHLPVTGVELFGREAELELLDNSWKEGKTNVISFVAWGGVGKSTLINRWLAEMAMDSYRAVARVFGWSFYSQGTGEWVTSADRFIAEALAWFGDPDPTTGSPWDKGQRLADLIRKERTLLVLDGLEPLQAEHDFERGRIKDPGLAVLIKELAKDNPGLCLITTREQVADLKRFPQNVLERNLEQISAQAGRALLRVGGVRGTDRGLEDASRAFGNHALAVKLLAAYLHAIPEHHIKHAADIPDLDILDDQGRQPRRVMAALLQHLGDCPEVEYLRILGLFDRPADQEALTALLTPPPIPDLTGQIMAVAEGDRHDCLTRLRRLGLLAPASSHRVGDLDCHPLVREHMADLLQKQFPQAWQQGNLRLYEHYKGIAKEYPDTIEEMAPLFYACAHGCRAGNQQEALIEVYWKRIKRGNEHYCTRKLGAFGSDLAALANFFDSIWDRPAPGLAEMWQAWVLGNAGFRLKALGRLAEAKRPMRDCLEMCIRQRNWSEASKITSNLSELFLDLGEMAWAVEYGQQTVELAARSGNRHSRVIGLTTHAVSRHQAGQLAEAEELFRQAEAMQREEQLDYPMLYSLRGFQYCDLLFDLYPPTEVWKRVKKTLGWAEKATGVSLLDIGLDHLTMGRACQRLGEPVTAATYLAQAIDFLRKANFQEILPRGLLARAAFCREQGQLNAARRDLEEVLEIAEPCGMRLHLTDYHLESCRLGLAENELPTAHEHLDKAKKLVAETGYHRRDREVQELEKLLAAADTAGKQAP
ncbi:MAG: toll/interleukin-1 receptor domain-containing protein [Thermodesulfobacteriota bacterium]